MYNAACRLFLNVDGLRVTIYLNDHPPAHVHVVGAGWSVVIDLEALEVRTVVRSSERDALRALELVAAHRVTLLASWKKIPWLNSPRNNSKRPEPGGEALLRGPVAVGAHYDEGRDRVIICLSTGIELGLRPSDVEGLGKASAKELSVIEVEAAGLGIRFPALDADLYVPGPSGGRAGIKALDGKDARVSRR